MGEISSTNSRCILAFLNVTVKCSGSKIYAAFGDKYLGNVRTRLARAHRCLPDYRDLILRSNFDGVVDKIELLNHICFGKCAMCPSYQVAYQ